MLFERKIGHCENLPKTLKRVLLMVAGHIQDREVSDQSVRRAHQATVLHKKIIAVLLSSHAVKATDQKLHGVATIVEGTIVKKCHSNFVI